MALFIFGLISVAGVSLLRSSADGQVALKGRLSGHSAVMRSANLIEADLAQVVPRLARDSLARLLPAFTNDVGALDQNDTRGQPLFIFTRTGLSAGNVGGASSVGRIGYVFSDGSLRRISWHGADGGPATTVTLLSDLTSVSARFRDSAGEWRGGWNFADPLEIPRAAEVTITPKSRPPFRLVMLIGTQQRPPPELETAGSQGNQGQGQNPPQGPSPSQGQNPPQGPSLPQGQNGNVSG